MLLWTALACHHRDEGGHDLALAPLEPNHAAWPAGTADDEFPETIEVVSGGDDSLWWADGRGYVDAPIARVWQAALDPDVGVDRREVDEWTVTDESAGDLAARYLVHITVHDVITVEYDLEWRFEVQQGTADDPVEVVGVWDKIDGTTFIDILRGSIVLRQGERDDVTEVELEEQLKAAARDDQTLVSFLNDFFASLVASSHGDPLPTW